MAAVEGQVIRSEDRLLAAWEIVSVASSVLIIEWVVFSVAGRDAKFLAVPLVFAFVFMFVSHYLRRESARDLGWRLDNFTEAARLLAVPMLALTLLLVAFGWLTSSINVVRWDGGMNIVGLPTLGILWGLLQQYVLQGFINRRAQLIWGRGWKSVTLVALVFAVLHLPNPWLTAATFCGGLLWAHVYQRTPNLLAISISHGVMTWVFITCVPPETLRNLRVGYKFFS